MIWKASTVLCLFMCMLCDGRYAFSEQKVEHQISGHHGDQKETGHQKHENHGEYAKAYPSYEFSYKVDDPDTHDKKAQHEVRDGGKVTGNYWLIQPDGEKRYIKYRVDDKSGFTAVINYTSPHSSVYYNGRKHHVEAGDSEAPKKEEKIKESLDDARHEVEEKKEEVVKEENEGQIKEGGNEKDSNEKGKEESSPENENHEKHEGPPQNTEEHRLGDEKVSLEDNKDGKREGEPDGKQDGGDGNQEEGRGKEHDGDRNQESGKEQGHENVLDSDQDVKTNLGDKREELKHRRPSTHNLWAKFPSFTIIHDYPKRHEIPVWEKNDDPEFYLWPGVNSWKQIQSTGGSQDGDKKRGNIERKEEESLKLGGNENSAQEETRGDQKVKGEEKGNDEESKPTGEEKKSEDRRDGDEKKGGEKRHNESRKGRAEKTVNEESRISKRRGGEERRRSIQHRGNENRRGHIKFTPIPYRQGY